MILTRIITDPYFFDVKFDYGINYIYGEKKDEGSLNGIGKSLFLDFIDFCLLSNYERSSSSRLKDAYNAGILTNTSVTLYFTIADQPGHITRSFAKPKEALFTWDNKTYNFAVEDLKAILGDLIFGKRDYIGYFEPEWYRSLISFFVKIQKTTEEKFLNPLKYLSNNKMYNIHLFLLYLLSINNTLPAKFAALYQEKENISNSIKTIKKFITKSYGIKDPAEVRNKIETLEAKISDINKNIQTTFLRGNYDKFEEEADQLTVEIKQLYYENARDSQTIEEYKQSLTSDNGFSVFSVTKMFAEINEELGLTIKKELKDALDFRRKLSASRGTFITTKLTELDANIKKREKLIDEKETRRQKLLNSIYSKNILDDISSAYSSLSDLQAQKEELSSQIRLLNDLNSELEALNRQQQEINKQLPEYLSKINPDITKLNSVTNEVFNFIYPDMKIDDLFSIDSGSRNTFLKMKFLEKIKHSHGKNIGRTLIFDLSVILYNLYNNSNSPRFLIHDGIFDSLDKAHLIKTYEFINAKIKQGIKFQYITTVNEGGLLNKNFGAADLITPERMKKEAKLVLGPKNKLLKTDFL